MFDPNDPITKLACAAVGVHPDELLYIGGDQGLKQFALKHPHPEPKVLKLWYEAYEAQRLALVNEVMKERRRILKERRTGVRETPLTQNEMRVLEGYKNKKEVEDIRYFRIDEYEQYAQRKIRAI